MAKFRITYLDSADQTEKVVERVYYNTYDAKAPTLTIAKTAQQWAEEGARWLSGSGLARVEQL